MYSPWNQSRRARKRPQRAVVPRLEILEERRLLSATQDDPIAEPLALAGGAEFQVNTTTLNNQRSPDITRFEDGSFAIKWRMQSNDFAFQRYSPAGSPIGGEVTVDNGDLDDLAIASDGTSIGVITANSWVIGFRFDAAGDQIGDYFFVKEDPGIPSAPRVFTDAAGNTAFLWRGGDGTPYRLFVRWYDAGGTPLGNAYAVGEVDDLNSYYDAAMNPDGELAITYSVDQYSVKGKALVIRPNGTSVGPVAVPAIDEVQSVAISPSGEFAVRYGFEGQLVQRYDATGHPLGNVINTGLAYSLLDMSLDSGGDLIVVGMQTGQSFEPGGSGWGVIARTYNADGMLETSLFPVNTTLPGNQQLPSVVSLNGAEFVISWQSQGQDGSGDGIFARRFVRDDLATVDYTAAAWGTPITDGETSFSELPGLRVTFSRPMNEASIESLANWQLLDDGVDISGLIAGVTYEDDVAYVTFTESLRGTGYELIVHDSIHDTLGRAFDGDDNASAGGAYSISFSVKQGIVGIGPERIIRGEVNQPSGSPVIAIQEDGGFAVGYNTGGWIPDPAMTEVRVFDSEGQTSSPIVGFESYSSGLMALGNGQYLAHINGGVRLLDATGAGPQTAFVGGGFHSAMPQVAARQSNGDFIVAKTVSVSGDFDVYIQRFAADGSSLGPAIPLSPPGDGNKQWGPAIYVMENDEFVVAWGNSPMSGPGYAIQFRRYATDGTPKGDLTEVTSGSIYGGAFDIAGDAADNFTIVWGDGLFGPSGNIYTRRYNSDGFPLSGAIHRRSTADVETLAPSIAMDDSGRSMISWKEGTDVYAQAFDAQGNSIFDPFVINSQPAPTNYVFAPVEMTGAGEAVVAWASASNDIRARRLSLGAFPVLDLNGAGDGIDFAADKDPGELLLPIVDADELTITTSSPTLVGATIQMDPALMGGELGIDTIGTNITATYTASGVTLSGIDTVANYQQVLRTVVFAPPYSFEGGEITEIEFTIDDGSATSPIATARVRNTAPAEVLGRHLYYAGAKYDDPLPGPHYSNAAYDVSKAAYQAGSGASTFANVSSYTRGINGIVLFTNGDYGVPSLSDFTFKMGTSTDPGTWIDAPTPSAITFREGAGTGGTDILELTWPEGAIKNTWLEVTMLANENTGLATDDVFYFGSRVGDTGLSNSPNAAITSAADQLAVRAHPSIGAGIENPYDFDRNGVVSAGDELTARFNPGILLMLNLPAPAEPSTAEPLAFAEPSPVPFQLAGHADRNALASDLQPTAVGEILQPVSMAFEPAAPSVPSQRLAPDAVAIVLANDEDLTLETDEPAAEEATREGLLEMLDSL